jgi:hypothetical protein
MVSIANCNKLPEGTLWLKRVWKAFAVMIPNDFPIAGWNQQPVAVSCPFYWIWILLGGPSSVQMHKHCMYILLESQTCRMGNGTLYRTPPFRFWIVKMSVPSSDCSTLFLKIDSLGGVPLRRRKQLGFSMSGGSWWYAITADFAWPHGFLLPQGNYCLILFMGLMPIQTPSPF